MCALQLVLKAARERLLSSLLKLKRLPTIDYHLCQMHFQKLVFFALSTALLGAAIPREYLIHLYVTTPRVMPNVDESLVSEESVPSCCILDPDTPGCLCPPSRKYYVPTTPPGGMSNGGSIFNHPPVFEKRQSHHDACCVYRKIHPEFHCSCPSIP
jgi:hypothetical protein